MSLETVQKRVESLVELRRVLAAWERIPSYDENPDFYRDWSEEIDFKVQIGKGECAQ